MASLQNGLGKHDSSATVKTICPKYFFLKRQSFDTEVLRI